MVDVHLNVIELLREAPRVRSKSITFAVCYFCVIFQSNSQVHARNVPYFDKSISLSGSKSAGVWGRAANSKELDHFAELELKKYFFELELDSNKTVRVHY